jgi:hypothetical protein
VPKYRAADVPLKPAKTLKEDVMGRRMEIRFRRMLRLFWETVCPYEIHWGMEQQQARAYSAGGVKCRGCALEISYAKKHEMSPSGNSNLVRSPKQNVHHGMRTVRRFSMFVAGTNGALVTLGIVAFVSEPHTAMSTIGVTTVPALGLLLSSA